MRKYIRAIIRAEGETQHLKASRYVKSVFENLQQKRYGVDNRRKNQAKGTHKKYLWRSRTANIGAR